MAVLRRPGSLPTLGVLPRRGGGTRPLARPRPGTAGAGARGRGRRAAAGGDVRRGVHPGNGDRLCRAWRTDGVTGYDLTFSTLKSVSTLWALGSEDVAAAAMAAHRAAVKAGLAYLDTHAAWSRRGTDGVEQVATEGLAVALFDHRTSRDLDPQLHTHALILNKVQCVDGTWRTLDGKEMFDHKKSAGMIYHAALRNEMRQRLGVEFEPVSKDGQADIRGVPAELLSLWSKRSRAIDAEAGPKIAEYEKLLGRTLTAAERARVIKTAVLKTRPGKSHEPISVLHATWAAEAATVGWTPERLQEAARVVWRYPETPDRPLPTAAPTLAQTLEQVLPTPNPTGQNEPRTRSRTSRWRWPRCRPRGSRRRCSAGPRSPGRSPRTYPPTG